MNQEEWICYFDGLLSILGTLVPVVQTAVPRRWGHGKVEPDDVFDARWEAYFNRYHISPYYSFYCLSHCDLEKFYNENGAELQ